MIRLKVLLVIAILFWGAGFSFAAVAQGVPEGPVDIIANEISYIGDDDIFVAVGAVEITFTDGFLTADRVTVNRATNQAWAEGNVTLRSGQDTLTGERLFFHLISKTGILHQGRIFISENHFYVEGERIEKRGEATYHLEKGTVTTCDGDSPAWRIAGSEIDVTVGGYGTIKHGRLQAGNLPVFYTPYFVFPAKTKRQSGLLTPSFGYSKDKNGMEIEIPFYWAISESADATYTGRYMSERGFLQGVEFRYHPSEKTFGTFYGEYLRDGKRVTETEGGLFRDWKEDQNRWSYYLNHETTFDSGFRLRSDIRKVSDNWYFKDFSASNYYRQNYSQTESNRFRRISFLGDESLASLDSTVRLNKSWSKYDFTALVRYTDDFSSHSNDYTLQKYPELTLTGYRQPLLGSLLLYDFTSTYDYFYRTEGQKGHFWEVSPNLYLPFNLGPIQVTPFTGFTGSLWDRTDDLDGREKSGNRQVFRFGTSASTEVGRVFDVGIGGIDKIRHAIIPGLSYIYVPKERQEYLPNYMSVLPEQHSVSYYLLNTIIARHREKDGTVRYDEMMRLLLSQSYNILESRRDVAPGSADRRPFGAVNVELDLRPIRYFSFAARNIYNVNSGVWSQTNYDLTLTDNRGDMAILGYRYTQNSLEEINLFLKATVTPSLDAFYVQRRNVLGRKNIETSYGIRYKHQCWLFDLTLTETQNDKNVMFYITLVGLGGIGGGYGLASETQPVR